MKSKKRIRFRTVAEKRVDKILDMFRLLGNCSNMNNYEYTKDEVDFIFDEVRMALKDAHLRFDTELRRIEQKKFKFK